MRQIWDRLDEVLGAGMLTTVAIFAMAIGYDSSVAQMSITGVVALLAVKAVKTPETNEPGLSRVTTKLNQIRANKSEEKQNGK